MRPTRDFHCPLITITCDEHPTSADTARSGTSTSSTQLPTAGDASKRARTGHLPGRLDAVSIAESSCADAQTSTRAVADARSSEAVFAHLLLLLLLTHKRFIRKPPKLQAITPLTSFADADVAVTAAASTATAGPGEQLLLPGLAVTATVVAFTAAAASSANWTQGAARCSARRVQEMRLYMEAVAGAAAEAAPAAAEAAPAAAGAAPAAAGAAPSDLAQCPAAGPSRGPLGAGSGAPFERQYRGGALRQKWLHTLGSLSTGLLAHREYFSAAGAGVPCVFADASQGTARSRKEREVRFKKMVDSEVTLEFVQGLAESVGPLILEGFGCGVKSSGEGEDPKTKASAADLVTEFDVRVEDTLKSTIKNKFASHKFLCEGKTNCFAVAAAFAAPTPAGAVACAARVAAIAAAAAGPAAAAVVAAAVNFFRMLLAEVAVIAALSSNLTSQEPRHDYCCCFFAVAAIILASKGVLLLLLGRLVPLLLLLSQLSTSRFFASWQLEETEDAEALAKLQRFKECVLTNVEFVTTHCRDIRHMGSTAMELCYLAAGRLDCVATFGPKEWDLAAGCLILEEAGAVCSDMQGGQPLDLSKHQVIAAATPELLAAMRRSLKCP
ncbi:hypothetical protein Emag_005710 [Eimeria magna]